MLEVLPQKLILSSAGAFFVGWVLSAISSRMITNRGSSKRDERDNRIRSLEAEQRIAKTEIQKSGEQIEKLEKDLADASEGNDKRDKVIVHQQGRIDGLSKDLKNSVRKTRELRAELSQRATDNLKSEMKIREVQTELEVAQASTDFIATGVLDYSLAPDKESDETDEVARPDFSKTAT